MNDKEERRDGGDCELLRKEKIIMRETASRKIHVKYVSYSLGPRRGDNKKTTTIVLIVFNSVLDKMR